MEHSLEGAERKEERRALSRYLSLAGLTLLVFLLAARLTTPLVGLIRWYCARQGVVITDTLAQVVNMTTYSFSILAPLGFFAFLNRNSPWKIFPLGLPKHRLFFPALGVTLGVCSTTNYLSSWLTLLLEKHFPVTVPTYQATIPHQGLPMVLGVLSAALLPAILEELLFRGALLQGARPFGDGFAVVFSAVAFALCHTTVAQLLPALLAGLCFGYFAVLSGSLLTTMVIHCLYNLMAAAVELCGTLWGAEAQRLLSVGLTATSLLLCLGGYLVLCRRCRDDLRLRRSYGGFLTLGDRLGRLALNIPLLTAVAMLCYSTWQPVLRGVLLG